MDVHELTAAYALDALDDDDRARFEAHLPQCERCRSELAGLAETAGALALAAPPAAPPEALRARILDAAAAERENVVPLRPRGWLTRGLAAATAVAACAAIGLGIWGATLSHRLDNARATSAATEEAAQILVDPATKTAALEGGSGMIAVSPTGRGVLVVRNLPPAPAGMTYEAWVIPHGATAQAAGLFSGGPMTMLELADSVPPGALVAATLEKAGGTKTPTSAPVFSART